MGVNPNRNNPHSSWALPAAALTLTAALGVLLLPPVHAAEPTDTAPAPAPEAYARLVSEYLEGQWDDLETDLAADAKAPWALPPSQRADVTYVRQTLTECRPAWWKQCKAGQKVTFRPGLWGRTLPATYDPAAKSGIQLQIELGQVSLTVNWNAKDMDNPAQAEHGFSKGELCNLGVWATLGSAESWAAIPPQSQVNLKDDARTLLTRYLDFRGNVSGTYYGTPRARRWGLWLYLAGYLEKYAKMPTVMGRQAVGAMFVAEVVAHADQYPSIPLPKSLPAEAAEEKLALHFKDWIEKHGWTLAEDRFLREAIKTLATVNDRNLRQTGKVALSNGLTVSLDPDLDRPNRPKRDAWVKAQWDKTPK